jgi:hypothetical protein
VQCERPVVDEAGPEQGPELLLGDAMTRCGSCRWAGSVNIP